MALMLSDVLEEAVQGDDQYLEDLGKLQRFSTTAEGMSCRSMVERSKKTKAVYKVA